MIKTHYWSKQYFKVGDTVSARSGFPWIKYPKKMKVIKVHKNKHGRFSYRVVPPAIYMESKRKHNLMLLEELVPGGSVVGP